MYFQNEIRVKIIIDQINELYNLESEDRSKYLSQLRQLRANSTRPMIMVSSKNNPYKNDGTDPVKYAAGSTRSNIYHRKIILDDYFSI